MLSAARSTSKPCSPSSCRHPASSFTAVALVARSSSRVMPSFSAWPSRCRSRRRRVSSPMTRWRRLTRCASSSSCRCAAALPTWWRTKEKLTTSKLALANGRRAPSKGATGMHRPRVMSSAPGVASVSTDSQRENPQQSHATCAMQPLAAPTSSHAPDDQLAGRDASSAPTTMRSPRAPATASSQHPSSPSSAVRMAARRRKERRFDIQRHGRRTCPRSGAVQVFATFRTRSQRSRPSGIGHRRPQRAALTRNVRRRGLRAAASATRRAA